VLLTTNVNSPTPDAFSFAILDTSLFNIPTTGLGDTLVFVNIDGASPAVQLSVGTGNFAGVVAVPEPDMLLMLSFGLGVIGLARRMHA